MRPLGGHLKPSVSLTEGLADWRPGQGVRRKRIRGRVGLGEEMKKNEEKKKLCFFLKQYCAENKKIRKGGKSKTSKKMMKMKNGYVG